MFAQVMSTFSSTIVTPDLTYLGVFLIIALLGADPASSQLFSNGVGQGQVVVPGGRHAPVLHQGQVEVPVEAVLDLRHISVPPVTRRLCHDD